LILQIPYKFGELKKNYLYKDILSYRGIKKPEVLQKLVKGNDRGALWENLMISERMKRNFYLGNFAQLYFWRTLQMKEIDLIEELDGKIMAFEFKEKPGKVAKMPHDFIQNYPNATFETITPDNCQEFLRLK
jgi:predicted AAA+ superfamily ATPase